jgi:hypothetical protein
MALRFQFWASCVAITAVGCGRVDALPLECEIRLVRFVTLPASRLER